MCIWAYARITRIKIFFAKIEYFEVVFHVEVII